MITGFIVRKIVMVSAMGGLLVSGCRAPESEIEAALEEAGYGTTPEDFHRAAEIGDLVVMERMLDGGMALDVPAGLGDTALHAAAAAGSVSAVAFLAERGLAVDVRGAANRTPLMAAAEANEGEACSALLKMGAKPELSDDNGYRAITIAADLGNVEAIRTLAVHSRDHLDDALLLASLRGHGEAAGVLAEYGASVYARMDDGLTPLMLAAREGHDETVRVLLEQGANRYAVDFDGRTAGQIAAEAKHPTLAELLNSDPGVDAFKLVEVPALEAWSEAVEPGNEGALPGAMPGAVIGHQAGEDAVRDIVEDEPPGGEAVGGVADPIVGDPGKVDEEEPWEKEMLLGGNAVAAPAPNDGAGPQAGGADEVGLVMETYREKPLPLRVEGVEGKEARVRYLFGENRNVTVKEGEEIPFTGLRVVKIEQRYDDSKMSLGRPLDVSTVVIEDPLTGRRRELVAKLGASAHEPFAVLRPRAGGEPMVALQGGVLRVSSGAMYVVLDVRPSQVVLENTATGQVHTVSFRAANQ